MMLIELKKEDIKEFKCLMQESFQFGYESVYGKSDELILPEKDIDECLNKENSHAYEMIDKGQMVGGAIIEINENHLNELDLLFVKVGHQGKNIGYEIFREIEKLYPDTKIWKTHTPYFDKRNLHFYINKLNFHAVEFFNEKHPEPDEAKEEYAEFGGMFRFEKIMKNH